MKGLLRHQLVRFVLVGGLNTAFSYGIYASLLYAGLPYVIANFFALALGVLFSFRTQGALVFGNRQWRLFFRFAACWGAIFLFNIAVIAALIRTGLDAYAAGALAMLPVTLLSFVLQRYLVFRRFDPGRTEISQGVV